MVFKRGVCIECGADATRFRCYSCYCKGKHGKLSHRGSNMRYKSKHIKG